MSTLKKEFVQDNMSRNTGLINIHKYGGGTFSFVKSKSWTKANVDFHENISPNLKNDHSQL
jgi:phosphosulfolactate synthase (CoM biosynthesis protein A)